ncbi:MAG: zinc-ribbon domain-containing protein [Candidatus Hodarchaeota archaeon]
MDVKTQKLLVEARRKFRYELGNEGIRYVIRGLSPTYNIIVFTPTRLHILKEKFLLNLICLLITLPLNLLLGLGAIIYLYLVYKGYFKEKYFILKSEIRDATFDNGRIQVNGIQGDILLTIRSYNKSLSQHTVDFIQIWLGEEYPGLFDRKIISDVDPLKILNTRLAKGEITLEQYNKLRGTIVEGKCLNCGAPMDPTYKFCGSCGTKR